ncbi:unnamed protein product [Ectocarpus sp. 4 AP-2014]
MKAWQRITHWRWRSSKWSKSKTPPPEGSAQAEEETTPPPQAATAVQSILLAGELEGILLRVGQVQRNGNGEEEETKVDPSRQSHGPKESPGEDPVDERLLRKQEELVRTGNEEEMIQELHASLLKMHDNLRRSEEMAAARLKAVEDEKAALEVPLREERAKTAMQEKIMHFLRQTNIQAQSVEIELRNQVETLQKEKRGQGLSHTKEQKIRSGLARLVENDLRKQVATLAQSRWQQANEIRRLSTQLQGLEVNRVPLIGDLITVLSSQGASATFTSLGNAHPDCTRLRADFYPGWEAPGGVAIVRMFRITVPESVRQKHLNYVRRFGNVVQRFHGTSCRSSCNFILDPKNAAPCGQQGCNLCNICLQGFKLGKASTRFGPGVYFSKAATKASSYAMGTEKKENGKKLRCIFVADVAKGRAYITKKKGFDASRYPPVGHDSVQGEVGKGLAVEELVVYKEEAALPTHLVVYSLR